MRICTNVEILKYIYIQAKREEEKKNMRKSYKIKFSRHSHCDECERTSTQKYTWCIFNHEIRFSCVNRITARHCNRSDEDDERLRGCAACMWRPNERNEKKEAFFDFVSIFSQIPIECFTQSLSLGIHSRPDDSRRLNGAPYQ